MFIFYIPTADNNKYALLIQNFSALNSVQGTQLYYGYDAHTHTHTHTDTHTPHTLLQGRHAAVHTPGMTQALILASNIFMTSFMNITAHVMRCYRYNQSVVLRV